MKTTTLQMKFIEAVRHKEAETARLCMEAGADPNLRSGDARCMHPLFEAIWSDVYEETRDAEERMLSLLLHYGADPNALDKGEDSDSILMLCALLGRSEAVRLLIERGADVNHRGEEGCTALMECCSAGHVECMKLLLAAGSHINVRSEERNDTPLARADFDYTATRNERSRECGDILRQAGAVEDCLLDIEECPNLSSADYAFLHAVLHNDTQAAVSALESGADVNAKDRYGCSAYPQAESYGNAELCRLLRERGIESCMNA